MWKSFLLILLFLFLIFQFLTLEKQPLLITGLPKFYYDGCYTEEDLAKLLKPFGFEYATENIYVVPQTRMVGTRFNICIGLVYNPQFLLLVVNLLSYSHWTSVKWGPVSFRNYLCIIVFVICQTKSVFSSCGHNVHLLCTSSSSTTGAVWISHLLTQKKQKKV